MKKIKDLVKKGGIADIVTLIIIVGLVIALIITVVVPMINDVEENQGQVGTNMESIQTTTNEKVQEGLASWD